MKTYAIAVTFIVDLSNQFPILKLRENYQQFIIYQKTKRR